MACGTYTKVNKRWAWRGSNPRLNPYKESTLTAELHPRNLQEAGLEPASRVATDFKSAVYTIPPLLLKTVLLGLEPRQKEPKSFVLPITPQD